MNTLKRLFARKRPCYRQGDVFLVPIDALPAEKLAAHRSVLAEGEITGHAHRLTRPDSAEVYVNRGQLYLNVSGDTATVEHEEHKPITVPRGVYEVRIQREYSPREIRRVVD